MQTLSDSVEQLLPKQKNESEVEQENKPHAHIKWRGPQGGLMGILEYLSQTNKNTDFIDQEDKFTHVQKQ